MTQFCRNGLHELDPWEGPDRRRCQTCHPAWKRRYHRSGKGIQSAARQHLKRLRAQRVEILAKLELLRRDSERFEREAG